MRQKKECVQRERWIEEYQLQNGEFDITDVNKDIEDQNPRATQNRKL